MTRIWARIKGDELKLARYSRAFLLWASGLTMQVLSVPLGEAAHWGPREWAKRFAIAALMGAAGLITGGQRNPTPEQLRAMLREGDRNGHDTKTSAL